MKFSKFFDDWLNKGYYKKGVNIGRDGDFFTSVSVGSVFGIIVSMYILDRLCKFKGKVSIVEIGANEGYLLADIIQGIFTFSPKSISKFEFVIIEPHDNLAILQKENFKKFFGDEIELLHLKSLEEANFENAIFVSNELFDTFPCEVVDNDKMLYANENGCLYFDKILLDILEFTKVYSVIKGEIPLGFYEFFNQICNSCERFYFITFDYGYMGSRGDISLRIYKDHKVYNLLEESDLSLFYQKSDITYDVNFEILKGEFLKFDGVKFESFKKQSVWLMDMGASFILEFIAKNAGENAYKNASMQLKRLVYELGERFKVIEFSKGVL